MAFLDFGIFFDDNGRLLPVNKMSKDALAALAALEVVSNREGDLVKKIRVHNKLKALNDLAKHLGFFKEDNKQGRPTVILHDPSNPDGDA